MLKDPRQRRFFKSNDLYELFSLGQTAPTNQTETSTIFAGTGVDIVPRKLKRKKKSHDSDSRLCNAMSCDQDGQNGLQRKKRKSGEREGNTGKKRRRIQRAVEPSSEKMTIGEDKEGYQEGEGEKEGEGEREKTPIALESREPEDGACPQLPTSVCLSEGDVPSAGTSDGHHSLTDPNSYQGPSDQTVSEAAGGNQGYSQKMTSGVCSSEKDGISTADRDTCMFSLEPMEEGERKRKRKKKKKKKQKGRKRERQVKVEGVAISGLERTGLYLAGSKDKKEGEEKERESRQDDYILTKLFKKSGECYTAHPHPHTHTHTPTHIHTHTQTYMYTPQGLCIMAGS